MIHLDELKSMLLYKRQVHLPIDEKNKQKGSAIILVTPSIKSSINMINHPMIVNLYHHGYFIEKDITYYINKESMMMVPSGTDVILEDGLSGYRPIKEEYKIGEHSITINTENGPLVVFFNNNLEENEKINEGSIDYNNSIRKIIYNERFKTPKDVFAVYDQIKLSCQEIKNTFLDLPKYREYNIFSDFYYYNELFFKNNMYKLDKGVDLYLEFLTRFIKDSRLEFAGYKKKTVFIPVIEWASTVTDKKNLDNYTMNINPISIINRLMINNYKLLQEKWKDINFVFFGNNSYFKIDFNEYDEKVRPMFMTFINKLADPAFVPEETSINPESPKSIATNVVDRLEKTTSIKINNLTGSEETTEAELMKKINQAAITSKNADDAIDTLSQDADTVALIQDVLNSEKSDKTINNSRLKRLNTLNKDYYDIKVNGKTIQSIIDDSNKVQDIPTMSLNIDSINDEWKTLKFTNFESHYDMHADILQAANAFNEGKELPVAVRNVTVDNSTTSEDLINTYSFEMEDSFGKRFTVKLDIPKMKDDKILVLRGNEKAMNKQLILLPIAKTDEDTVQIVSNYNKIFIYRFGQKSFPSSDRIIKTFGKLEESKKEVYKVQKGFNSKANNKFTLPIDYIDLSEKFSTIDTPNMIYYFNQKTIREKYKSEIKDDGKGFPYAYNKKEKKIEYCSYESEFSPMLSSMLCDNPDFKEVYDATTLSKKYMYSRARIMNTFIPLVVILSYSEGLFSVMKKAGIIFSVVDKRPQYDKDREDIIKFNDGYILYKMDYEASLLMNGLKECNTEDYSIKDTDSKSMWLDFLDIFGNRILADGIENFHECMIDKPITYEVLQDLGLPTDYTEVLLYGNHLLADTGFTKHTSMEDKRIRSNEIIAGFTYKVLADAYGDYRKQVKNGRRDPTISVKQTAVIDKVLELPTVADLSTINVVNEVETVNAISPKGLSGMNADRAFGLDKRGFDKSMVNVIGMSTIIAAAAGINRQCTIDADIRGKRGYINAKTKEDEMSITKTFTFSESLTPFGNRDSAERASMKYSQDKHSMRVAKSSPLLVTNGADEALPYMCTNTFAFKAREDGEVVEATEDFLVVKYKSGKTDFVDLRTKVKKNSGGGFYIPLKLESSYKKGNKFKKLDILAHDPLSFSDAVGHADNLAHNVATFAKIAIINSDQGYEDSCIIDHYLSEAMASDVVLQKEVVLGPNANILSMVSKGDSVNEGESLMIFQNSFDDEDINSLLKNLAADEEEISDLGRIPVKSKVTGVVEDIKVFRTVETDVLSPSMKKKVGEIEKSAKAIKSIVEKYAVEDANLYMEPTYKLAKEGKLKNVDGVLYEFYIKYNDKMSVGDKLTFFVALKGIVKDIFPEGDEPYTDYRPTEKIHAYLALDGLEARMITSVLPHGYINKGLVELVRKVRDILDIPYDVSTELL